MVKAHQQQTSAKKSWQWSPNQSDILPDISDAELKAVSIDNDKSGAYEDNIRGVEPGLYVICHLGENDRSMTIRSFAKHINEQHPGQAHEA